MTTTTTPGETPGRSSTSSNRRRKCGGADAIGRVQGPGPSGRGALVGWTTCPLCDDDDDRRSNKRYARGRGIAMHLHAVHTPWEKPGRAELKRRQRRKQLRRRVERRKQKGASVSDDEEKNDQSLAYKTWEPKQEEIDAWDAKVLEIVRGLDQAAEPSCRKRMRVSDDSGEEDLHCPANDDSAMVLAGLDRSGNQSQPYRTSLAPFLSAASRGDLEALQRMVEAAQREHGQDGVLELLDTRDRHLSIAEHWAAGGGHLECLKYLMALRKSMSSTRTLFSRKIRRRDGKTALHYAARNGRLDCITFLVDNQLHDVNERSGDGTTPLHLALFGGHFSAVELLLCKGANAAFCNDWGCSGAHWLGMTRCQSKDDIYRMCDMLKSHGLSFVVKQKQGHTALHKAAQRVNRHVIEWMASAEEENGAGLSQVERRLAGEPDDGGHKPSDIWLKFGGDESFASWMRHDLQW